MSELRKYGILLTAAKSIQFTLYQIDGVDIEPAATFVDGDVKISKDGGAEGNVLNLPTDNGQGYSIVLTAAELTASRIRLFIVDQTVTKAWLDIEINIETFGNASAMFITDFDEVMRGTDLSLLAANINLTGGALDEVALVTGHTPQTGDSFTRLATYRLGELMSAALASQPFAASLMGDLTQDDPDNAGTQQFTIDALDRAWDVILTGGTHNINNSSGKRLRQVAFTVFSEGTAQAATANTVQLASGAVSINLQFVRAKIVITGGTGEGQEAIISDSTASTDTVVTTPAWLVTPDATSTYEIMPAQVHETTRNGGYDLGRVYVNLVTGAAGTLQHVNGTTTNASSVLADARVLADVEKIRIFDVKGGGAVTLDQSYTNWIFEVINAALLDMNGQDVSGSVFMRTGVTGTGLMTTRGVFELCGMLNTTVGVCNFLQCGFDGTLTLSSEAHYLAWDCFENSASVPVINMAGDGVTTTHLSLPNYSGRAEIQNLTSVDKVVVTGQAFITLNANCTGGEIIYAGDVDITDNSGNVTLTLSDHLQIDADWLNGGRLDLLLDDVPTTAEFEARTPTAAELLYIVRHAATALPVTFTGGTTTTAILGNVNGVTASSTDDTYNSRLLVFNLGTLDVQVCQITDYVGSTTTATITAVTTAVTSSHTALLV